MVHARKAQDFFVTLVRADHGLVMDMFSSAPILHGVQCRPRQWIPCYHLIDYAMIADDDALVVSDAAGAPFDVDRHQMYLVPRLPRESRV